MISWLMVVSQQGHVIIYFLCNLPPNILTDGYMYVRYMDLMHSMKTETRAIQCLQFQQDHNKWHSLCAPMGVKSIILLDAFVSTVCKWYIRSRVENYLEYLTHLYISPYIYIHVRIHLISSYISINSLSHIWYPSHIAKRTTILAVVRFMQWHSLPSTFYY